MRRVLVSLLVLVTFVALALACGSQTVAPFVTVQWNVKSVTTKSKTGEVTRAEVSGYFIFTSATQSPAGNDGKLPPAAGTFVQDITLSRVRRVQSATYTISSDTKTLSLVVGDQTQNYTYKITSSGGVQTMTWDGQDETAAHWVLEAVETPDAGADAAADGADGD
jgi:hypothetical protein